MKRHLIFSLLLPLFALSSLSAQITYETSYTDQTRDNTSACSSAGDNSGACTGPNTITGTKNNNPVPINASKVDPRSLLGTWFTGQVFSAAMGWWTKTGHLCCVGYSSTDANQVQQQLQDMKSRGYNGMTMAWGGVKGSTCTLAGGFQNCTKDLSVQAFEQWLTAAASDGNFQVAIRGQKSIVDSYKNTNESDQDAMIRQLQYVQSQYFSSPGYMKIEINGDGLGLRPIVTFFISTDTCSGCDWAAIKSAVGHDVLFMKQDKNSYTMTGFEGAYSWGPAKDDNFAYENDFYGSSPNGAVNQPPTKLVWTDASKGFNDEDPANLGHSIWDSTAAARFVDQRCGHRWLDTWGHISTNYQGSTRRLDAVLVPTWNDYEEGTETETGIGNCILDDSNTNPITTTLNGTTLTWQDNWDQNELTRLGLSETEMEKTIHHYELYESDPANDEPLHLFYTLDNPSPYASPYNPPAHSVDLSQFGIPCNAKIYVKAVGQPSITNHMTKKQNAPTYCGTPPPPDYTYITALEEPPTTDWATLDDCGVTATCSTTVATSTLHSHDGTDAVKFTLAGDNPPGSQIGRWLRTVIQNTGAAADLALDLWVDLDATAYTNSAGLIFELSHVYSGNWYHFMFKCDFSSGVWQIWNELGNAWQASGVTCSRPPQNTYTEFTFHMQRVGTTVHYTDIQVNGGAKSPLNVDFTAQSTTWSNFNKVGIKLMGNTAMNDYSLYVDDLRLGYK